MQICAYLGEQNACYKVYKPLGTMRCELKAAAHPFTKLAFAYYTYPLDNTMKGDGSFRRPLECFHAAMRFSEPFGIIPCRSAAFSGSATHGL